MPVVKTCEVCNKEFSVPPVRAETAKTCSKSCWGKANAAKYQSRRITTACKFCGVEFQNPPCRSGERAAKYCSVTCKSAASVGVKRPVLEDGVRSKMHDGYMLITERGHPFAYQGLWLLEHRLVLERRLVEVDQAHPFLVCVDGRLCLRREIHVHHLNEIKDDNRVVNLVACTSAGHRALHRGGELLDGEVWPYVGLKLPEGARWVPATCATCGKDFLARRSQVARGNRTFCSSKCLADRMDHGLPNKVERQCFTCGKTFYVKRHKVLEGIGKFCSLTCRSQAFKGYPQSQWKQITKE